MAVGEGKSGANPGPTTQHLVGQGPCALPGVRYGIGGRTGASAPTEAYLAVRRGGALPLPRAGKSAKRCRWQRKRAGFEEVPRLAATTVAGNRLARRWAREPRPYERVTRGAVRRDDVGIVPYESVTGGAMGGRPQGSPLRRAARNVWAGYRPLRKFFDREGMVCFGFWWRRMTRAPDC